MARLPLQFRFDSAVPVRFGSSKCSSGSCSVLTPSAMWRRSESDVLVHTHRATTTSRRLLAPPALRKRGCGHWSPLLPSSSTREDNRSRSRHAWARLGPLDPCPGRGGHERWSPYKRLHLPPLCSPALPAAPLPLLPPSGPSLLERHRRQAQEEQRARPTAQAGEARPNVPHTLHHTQHPCAYATSSLLTCSAHSFPSVLSSPSLLSAVTSYAVCLCVSCRFSCPIANRLT